MNGTGAWRSLVVVLFWAYALLNTYFVLTPVLGDAPRLAFLLVPLLLGGFSLSHAIYTLGLRHALIFLAFTALISMAFEAAGVATGAVYGPYHYTDRLGPKLFDVPLIVYALLASGYVVGYTLLGRPALALVVLFAMGTSCLAALLRATGKTATWTGGQ
jgi:uncharacterized membrane protein